MTQEINTSNEQNISATVHKKDSKEVNKKSSNYFNFFSSPLSTITNKISSYLPKIDLMADGFKINGIPIYLPNSLKQPFSMVASFYLVTLAQAETTSSNYNSIYFVNPSNTTHYKFDYLKKSLMNNSEVITNALQVCQAILNGQPQNGIKFDLLKTVEECTGGGLEMVCSAVMKFFREAGDPNDSSFENCINSSISPNDNGYEMEVLVSVTGVSILLICICACVYKLNCIPRSLSRNINNEDLGLLENQSDKINDYGLKM